MKSRSFRALGLSLLVLFSLHAWGQLDTILLKHSGYSPSPQSLDSSRYTIRPAETHKTVPVDDDDDEKPGTYIASPVPKNTATKVSTSSPVHVDTTPPTAPAPPVTPPAVVQPAAPPVPVTPEKPSVTVQVKELILGGNDEDIDEAKRQIHPEDPRSNLVSISLAPAYFYDGSTSNYSYHGYQSSGPGFGLGMNLWFTPFFALQSNYFSSVSASVRDGASMVPLTAQELSVGVRFRRHFGYARKSAQLSWGVDYHDFSNRISTSSTSLTGSRATGLSLALEATIPKSNNYAHTIDLAVRPYQHHAELGTAVSVRSGTACETNALALSLGGQWTLDRRNQLFWKAEYSVERDLFTGPASPPDGHSGDTPNGVSVTNSLAIFYFGFKWGS